MPIASSYQGDPRIDQARHLAQLEERVLASELALLRGRVSFPGATAASTALVIGGDTNLYRSAADVLKTDDQFIAAGGLRMTGGVLTFADGTTMSTSGLGSASSLSNASDAVVTGDSDSSGAGAVILRTGTTDRLTVAVGGDVTFHTGQLKLLSAGLLFGSAGDTNLYRSADSVLKTDDTFDAAALRVAGVALAATHLSDTALLARLASPALTGIPTAPTAATDASTTQLATTAFVIGQAGASNPLMNSAVAVGTSLRYSRQDHVHPIDTTRAPLASPAFTGTATFDVDTNLYRASADYLRTDDNFQAYSVTTQTGTANLILLNSDGKIYFGSAYDTNLYRAAADTLKTDDTFDAAAYRKAGVALAATHLSDTNELARLAGPTFTGTASAPTPAVGTNTTQLATTAFVRADSPVYNVKNYGALGDGTTNDRAAVQSAIDAALAATYGAIVYFPRGEYLIGTPGLSVATAAKPIRLEGAGMGGTAGIGTRLKRNGAYTLLSLAGTGTADANMIHGFEMSDMTLYGADLGGALVSLVRVAHMTWENVRLVGSTSYALYAEKLWNSSFRRCAFETSGNAASTIPCVMLTTHADSNGNTDTVHFSDCHFELNKYTDIAMAGVATTKPCNAVLFSNCKWERSESGPSVQFKQSQYCNIIGGSIYQPSGFAAIVEDGGLLNRVIGVNFASAGTALQSYLVQLTAGQGMALVGNTFIGGLTAHIRLDAGYGEAVIGPNSHYTLTTELDVSDVRTTKTGRNLDSFILPTHTVATLPAAATANAGSVAYVSDGAAGAVFRGSNGTAWVSLG